MLIYSWSSISTLNIIFPQRASLRRFAGGLATAAKAADPTPICVPRVTTITHSHQPTLNLRVYLSGMSPLAITHARVPVTRPFIASSYQGTYTAQPYNNPSTQLGRIAHTCTHCLKATSLQTKDVLSVDANSDLSAYANSVGSCQLPQHAGKQCLL